MYMSSKKHIFPLKGTSFKLLLQFFQISISTIARLQVPPDFFKKKIDYFSLSLVPVSTYPYSLRVARGYLSVGYFFRREVPTSWCFVSSIVLLRMIDNGTAPPPVEDIQLPDAPEPEEIKASKKAPIAVKPGKRGQGGNKKKGTAATVVEQGGNGTIGDASSGSRKRKKSPKPRAPRTSQPTKRTKKTTESSMVDPINNPTSLSAGTGTGTPTPTPTPTTKPRVGRQNAGRYTHAEIRAMQLWIHQHLSPADWETIARVAGEASGIDRKADNIRLLYTTVILRTVLDNFPPEKPEELRVLEEEEEERKGEEKEKGCCLCGAVRREGENGGEKVAVTAEATADSNSAGPMEGVLVEAAPELVQPAVAIPMVEEVGQEVEASPVAVSA
ncbi:hypothetical protein DFH27DRAFT_21763 [Peziza echinospora]|nr:hypothetical protein DFH27DRAFT_21763 [Peziza echinospora]